jgi:uncharacterized membrane protein YgcG
MGGRGGARGGPRACWLGLAFAEEARPRTRAGPRGRQGHARTRARRRRGRTAPAIAPPPPRAARPIQAGLLYRAVKMHVRMHNWQRALELAQKHGAHVDTVLLHRARHLRRRGGGAAREPLDAFRVAAAEVEVDEAAVLRRAAEEKARERAGGPAAAGLGGGSGGGGSSPAGGGARPKGGPRAAPV